MRNVVCRWERCAPVLRTTRSRTPQLPHLLQPSCCRPPFLVSTSKSVKLCTTGAASKGGKKKKKNLRCFRDSSATTTTTTRGRAAHVDNGVCERLEGLPHAKAEHVRVPPRGREPSNNSALRVYEKRKCLLFVFSCDIPTCYFFIHSEEC